MYNKITTQDPILIFSPPNPLNPDFTDADPSKVIDNPGGLAEDQVVKDVDTTDFSAEKRDHGTKSSGGPPKV